MRHTWIHTRINQIVNAPADEALARRSVIALLISNLLEVPGASCVESCDSVSVSSSNLIASEADIVSQSGDHSWIVIQFANGGQLLLSLDGGSLDFPNFFATWSATGAFANDGSTSSNPTATDEINITDETLQWSWDNSLPMVLHTMWTDDGLRFHSVLLNYAAVQRGTSGVLSMMFIDDPSSAAVSSSPRGIMGIADKWSFPWGIHWLGSVGSATEIWGCSLGNAPLGRGGGYAAAQGFSIDGVEQLFSVEALTRHGDTIVRAGTFADIYTTSQRMSVENEGHYGVQPTVVVLANGDRFAVFGSASGDLVGIALPWSGADVIAFGDGSDVAPSATVDGAIWATFIEGGGGDVGSPPVIASVSPTPNTAPGEVGGLPNNFALAKVVPIVIRVTDPESNLQLVVVTFASEQRRETAYRAGNFEGSFVTGSVSAEITGGFELSFMPDGGWPPGADPTVSSFVTLTIDAIDTAGNYAVSEFVYELPAAARSRAAPAQTTIVGLDHVQAALNRVISQFRDAR